MDEHQQLLEQCTALLPTGVPNGLDEALRSIRYGRQTRQVQQRVGHEDQTPMFPNGFGTPHAILVKAQLPLAVLVERFRRPPVQIQVDDLGGIPVHPVRHQHDIASCHLFVLKTHHDPDLAQAGDADPQRKAPIGVRSDSDRAIRLRRDQRDEILDRDVGTRQLHRPAVDVSQLKTGGFQPTVLLEQTDPVLAPPSQDLDQVLGQVPGVEHDHAKRHFVPNGLFHQLLRQRNFGLKLLMPFPKVGVFEQHRVYLLMQAIPCLRVGRDRQCRKVLGDSGFPLGQFFIPTIQAQAEGEAHWATDIQAGDGVMGQGIRAIAVVVMPIHVVEEAPHMFAEGIINDDKRLSALTAMGFGLLEHKPEAAAIDRVLAPGGLREKAGEVGVVGAIHDAAGHIGHAFVG
jgi:hypothetical protein